MIGREIKRDAKTESDRKPLDQAAGRDIRRDPVIDAGASRLRKT